MTGHRLSLSTLYLRGVFQKEFLVEVALQLGGNYVLSRPMVDGSTLSYDKPRGYRASVGYNIGQFMRLPGLFAGVDAELLKFSEKRSTTLGVKDTSLSLFEIGASLTYVFK